MLMFSSHYHKYRHKLCHRKYVQIHARTIRKLDYCEAYPTLSQRNKQLEFILSFDNRIKLLYLH